MNQRAALVLAVTLLAGCSGGGATIGTGGGSAPGATSTPQPGATSTPQPGATQTPAPGVTPTPTPMRTVTPSEAHYPVLLIPGMTSVAATMQPMLNEFENAGWPADRVFEWTDTTDMEGEIGAAAMQMQAEVASVLAQTGARKVVLVTWSASALAGRYYLKNIDSSKVAAYIGMAGPQHGTTFNSCQLYYSCQEFASPNTPFLTALNAGTEVPGSPGVAYMTVRSDNDVNVAPEDSAMLAGANLNVRLTGPAAPTHFTYPEDPATFAAVEAFILGVEQSAPPVFSPVAASTATATPLSTPYPGTTYSTTCQTNSQFTNVATITLAASTPIPIPALDLCSGSITIPASDTVAGTGTIASWLSAPLGAPSPLPTNPNPGASNAPTVLFFSSLQLSPGSSIALKAGTATSPALNFTIGVPPVGTCSTYYELFGGSTLGWQHYGTGVAVGAATSIAFPSGPVSAPLVLDGNQTYYYGLICF